MSFLFPREKGFTLIELVVTVSVFVLLSASLLGNYRATTKSLSLNSLANFVAADIRRAQTNEIGSISLNESAASGISFDMTYPNAYMAFTDSNNNFRNDSLGPSCSGECTERMIMRGGSTITQLCGDKKNTGNCAPLRSLHIAFLRPDPEPKSSAADYGIRGVDAAGNVPVYSDAEITISSADGSLAKTIVIWSTGLISIE